MSAAVSTESVNPFLITPLTLQRYLCPFLDSQSLARYASVCKAFQQICEKDQTWQNSFTSEARDYWSARVKEGMYTWRQVHQRDRRIWNAIRSGNLDFQTLLNDIDRDNCLFLSEEFSYALEGTIRIVGDRCIIRNLDLTDEEDHCLYKAHESKLDHREKSESLISSDVSNVVCNSKGKFFGYSCKGKIEPLLTRWEKQDDGFKAVNRVCVKSFFKMKSESSIKCRNIFLLADDLLAVCCQEITIKKKGNTYVRFFHPETLVEKTEWALDLGSGRCVDQIRLWRHRLVVLFEDSFAFFDLASKKEKVGEFPISKDRLAFRCDFYIYQETIFFLYRDSDGDDGLLAYPLTGISLTIEGPKD